MTENMPDDDFEILVRLATKLEGEYGKGDDPWVDSPFAWIRKHSSRRRGKIGEQLVAGYFAAKGFEVGRAAGSSADRLIGRLRIEIKFSTLWESGIYKFQQIRDQDYAAAICLGISPTVAHCWVVSKPLLAEFVIGKMGQHTGAAGKDTAWLSVQPEAVPSWLAKCGGSLHTAAETLRTLVQRAR